MKIPKIIEGYYSRQLFKLIQAELKDKGITIEKPEHLGGVMVMQRIGSYLTMYMKDDKMCSYSDPFFAGGLFFHFNKELVQIRIPVIIMWLRPVFIGADWIKKVCFDAYINVKMKIWNLRH